MAPIARPTRSRARTAATLIRLARRNPARLFNSGLREVSAGIHEAAAKALLAGRSGLPVSSQRALRVALRDASALRSPVARAWWFGTTLDRVAATLRHRPRPELALFSVETGMPRPSGRR